MCWLVRRTKFDEHNIPPYLTLCITANHFSHPLRHNTSTYSVDGYYQPNDNSQTTQCLECDAGRYAAAVQPPNTVATAQEIAWITGNSTTCAICPDGSSSGQGDHECGECAFGTASSGGSACTACEAGTFATDGQGNGVNVSAVICEDCPVGRYDSQPGSAECLPCGQGRYSDTTGAETCTLCGAGYETTLGGVQTSSAADNCEPCPQGKFSGGFAPGTGYFECQNCGLGEYQNLTGQQDCHFCTEGKYGPTETNAECLPCPTGRFERSERSHECNPCTEGNHVNVTGATKCVACEKGRHQHEEGQQDCDLCVPGRHSTGTGVQDDECMCELFGVQDSLSLSLSLVSMTSFLISPSQVRHVLEDMLNLMQVNQNVLPVYRVLSLMVPRVVREVMDITRVVGQLQNVRIVLLESMDVLTMSTFVRNAKQDELRAMTERVIVKFVEAESILRALPCHVRTVRFGPTLLDMRMWSVQVVSLQTRELDWRILLNASRLGSFSS